MGLTNFAMLAPENIRFIQREIRHEMEAKSFLLQRFCGKGDNMPIEKITDLKRTLGGGLECIMTLVPMLTRDGGVGSAGGKREGVEESMKKFNLKITIDELWHNVRNEGELADQNSVVEFRKEGKSGLTTWLANRTDQLIMLTASGISYAYNLDGSLRGEDTLTKLLFAPYVTPPSAKRHRRWNGSTKTLDAGITANVTTSDAPSYKMLTMGRAYAKTHKLYPLMAGGKEWYVVLIHPIGLAQLKNDPDYKNAVIQGGVRGDDNPFFSGAIPTIDGLLLVECDWCYTTNGAAAKWGAGNAVNGTRTLLLGAKALGYADLGDPKWTEESFEYATQPGIMVSKMMGLLKPHFPSTWDGGTDEDFSLLCIDHYLEPY